MIEREDRVPVGVGDRGAAARLTGTGRPRRDLIDTLGVAESRLNNPMPRTPSGASAIAAPAVVGTATAWKPLEPAREAQAPERDR